MKRIFVFCVLSLAIAACSKGKVETVPHLSFKSFSSDVVGSTGVLQVNLEFTDQEGDLDSIFIVRQRLNRRGPAIFSFFYDRAPQFGKQNRGELQLNLDIAQDLIFSLSPLRIPGSNPSRNEPDTLLMKFYLKDKAGNVSDTAVAKPLIVIR